MTRQQAIDAKCYDCIYDPLAPRSIIGAQTVINTAAISSLQH
jgi:hypothetical protein